MGPVQTLQFASDNIFQHSSELVQWLWPKLIQQELDKFRRDMNDHKVRTDRKKILPSGVSPNVAFSLCEKYGGENCLQPVEISVIHRLMEEVGGEQLIQFVMPDYAAIMQAAYDSLGLESLTFDNIWIVFRSLLSQTE